MITIFRKINLVLLVLHIVSWLGLFYFNRVFIYLFVFLPIPILALTIVFGSGLGRISDLLLRSVSTVLLLGGLYQAYQYSCCSGEQGAVGIPFVVIVVMLIYLLVYGLVTVLHLLKKYSKRKVANTEHGSESSSM